jgi:hypothetical protein
VKASQLHTAATRRGDGWRSLRPHWPGDCYGPNGSPCPQQNNDELCEHRHRSDTAALACSRKREPFA